MVSRSAAVITFATSDGSQTLQWSDGGQFVLDDDLTVSADIDSTGTITGDSITDSVATLTGGDLTVIGSIGTTGDASLLSLAAGVLTIGGNLIIADGGNGNGSEGGGGAGGRISLEWGTMNYDGLIRARGGSGYRPRVCRHWR